MHTIENIQELHKRYYGYCHVYCNIWNINVTNNGVGNLTKYVIRLNRSWHEANGDGYISVTVQLAKSLLTLIIRGIEPQRRGTSCWLRITCPHRDNRFFHVRKLSCWLTERRWFYSQVLARAWNNARRGNSGLPQPVKPESRYITFTVLVRHKDDQNRFNDTPVLFKLQRCYMLSI